MIKYFILFLIVISTYMATAQNKLLWGVHGSLNVNSLLTSLNYFTTTDTYEVQGLTKTTSQNLLGLNAGFFVEAPIKKEFSIQPEINYSVLGGEIYWWRYSTKQEL